MQFLFNRIILPFNLCNVSFLSVLFIPSPFLMLSLSNTCAKHMHMNTHMHTHADMRTIDKLSHTVYMYIDLTPNF